ncbi:hypothetical protein L208DRAFT_1274035 [Tricholoma matsutake]|nr:hypothetical protein L208DRAFT_1274035 [Tricholoma matsutake 945]
MSYGSLKIFDQYSAQFALLNESHFKNFTEYLVNTRCTCQKELYAAKKAEILERAKCYDTGRIKGVLLGGSSKKLMSGSAAFVSLPTAVNSTSTPGDLVNDPASVAEETRQYFAKLYKCSTPPNKPNPWLTTPSVLTIKRHVMNDPFLWPVTTTLANFSAMLCKGNLHPSPGPDGWEKWCIKNLSDKALQLVLDLHNYSVINMRFMGNIKDTHLTYFHKHGIHTDLSNWRGLLISNFLANSPMTWLNFKLSPYAMRMGIIPKTQVATQPGTQTRDLMSFLSGLKTWSHHTKTPLYLLKQDQMKGFDYLTLQGFYNACTAYVLPQGVADLDCAAQSSTLCFPQMAFSIADPIMVEGITKQGGPMSPFKATITTSLDHHYLDNLASSDPDCVIIRSTSNLVNDPHLPDDAVLLHFTMAEATDNSYIAALTFPALQHFTLAMEPLWGPRGRKTIPHFIPLDSVK